MKVTTQHVQPCQWARLPHSETTHRSNRGGLRTYGRVKFTHRAATFSPCFYSPVLVFSCSLAFLAYCSPVLGKFLLNFLSWFPHASHDEFTLFGPSGPLGRPIMQSDPKGDTRPLGTTQHRFRRHGFTCSSPRKQNLTIGGLFEKSMGFPGKWGINPI